jgi:hypothetical protein
VILLSGAFYFTAMLSAFAVLTTKMLVNIFSSPMKTGAKEETWTDEHFWQLLPPLEQC